MSMLRYHWIGLFCVGVQSRGSEVLKRLLRWGLHPAEATVTSIPLRGKIQIAPRGFEMRIRVQYKLDTYHLLSLYESDDWRPVRASQIPELVAGMGKQALLEELAALSSVGVRDRSEEQLFSAFAAIEEPEQFDLLGRATRKLYDRLHTRHPWVFYRVRIGARPARA